MDIKAVLKNVSDKGLMETWEIHKLRKKNKDRDKGGECLEDFHREVKVKKNKKQCEHINYNAELELNRIADILQERTNNVSAKDVERKLQELADFKESLDLEYFSKYKAQLKKTFIKELIPDIYNLFRNEPVADKIIILQQRSKLNSSCKHIHDYLIEDGRYEVKFHELNLNKSELTEGYRKAIEFIIDFATARAVITHEQAEILGLVDIRPETKFIQLWHGLPIKKIRQSIAGMPGYKSKKGFVEYPENNYDLVPISAPEWRPVFEEFMGLPEGTPVIQSIGISRTDQFFDEEYIKNCYDKLYERVPKAREKKIILYAPTYRGLEPNRTAPDKLDVAKFAEALGDEYILIVKHHQTLTSWPEIPEPYNNDFAYDFRKIKGMDINELLTVADICISDYSSLVFDFALFERPIVFFAFDEEEYNDERGVYYTLKELDAGPVLKTNEEVIQHIKSMDFESAHQRAKRFRDRFMCSCDGHTNERILNYINDVAGSRII